ncbi:ABC transporter ATP-binding protein [Nocardia sp. NPDC055321]
MNATDAVLEVHDLCVRYGSSQALCDITFDVAPNSALAVLGANGAGKSTLARALSGLVPAYRGTVRFDGEDITRRSASDIRRSGLVHLPEGRGVFPSLTVLDNLRMALITGEHGRTEALSRAFDIFPVLGERRGQQAGTLSGGEQQMLSLARALMVSPRLIVADEMSLGLAPKMVDMVFDSLGRARATGVSVVMIEQFARRALDFADHCVILQRGNLSWSGPADQAGDELLHRYLGAARS